MLHSLFKGSKILNKIGNPDKDKNSSRSSSSRSSHRSGAARRLVRSKNIQGLRFSDDDWSADASRNSLLSADNLVEAISEPTCDSWSSRSPSPSGSIFQRPSDADSNVPLPPPQSLNNSTQQQSAQCNSPISSPRSWDGDMPDSDGASGYGTDSASSNCSVESSASHGIFSVFARHSEGDLQTSPGMQFGSSVGVGVVQRVSPSYRNGQGEGGGLRIRIQKSAPNSTHTSPMSSPKARGMQYTWNSASNQPGSTPKSSGSNEFPWQQTRPHMDSSPMAQNKTSSPCHPLSNGNGYGKSTRTDAHPLPLPPTLGTAPAAPSTTLLSPRSPLLSPRSPLLSPRSPMVSSPWGSSIPEAGAPVCKWKKGHLLGSGAFGKVYKGIHSETGEFCAIKEVEYVEGESKAEESAKQLAQEVMLLSTLRHPNIVHYKGSEMGDGFLNIYLELVSGGSIYKLYQEFKKLDELVIRRYTRQILLGLHFLHSKNIVHRDIKGANILVDQEGTVKLADFGMAKTIKEQGAAFLSFKGSPYWMAPEVIMQRNTGYEFAIDIWSLGCTVLEMVTGKPPWSEYEGVAAMFKVSRAEVPPIPENLSLEGQSFIKLCLQRNPADRPSAAQLLEHPFVQIPNNGPELTMPAINILDFLSPDVEERSTRQQNGGSSTGLLSTRSQPLKNSHYSHARMRTGVCPSRSAPVSPRSSHNDFNKLAPVSSADVRPGFSTPPAGSPRRGRGFDYYDEPEQSPGRGSGFDFYAEPEQRSNAPGKRAGRQGYASNGVAISDWEVGENRQIPHNSKPRSNGFYRSEDARPYQEEEPDYSRRPYRTVQKMDEKATRLLLERLPHQRPRYNGKEF